MEVCKIPALLTGSCLEFFSFFVLVSTVFLLRHQTCWEFQEDVEFRWLLKYFFFFKSFIFCLCANSLENICETVILDFLSAWSRIILFLISPAWGQFTNVTKIGLFSLTHYVFGVLWALLSSRDVFPSIAFFIFW